MAAFWTAALVLVLDQATKRWIRGSLSEGQIVPVLQRCFNITYVRNRGGAFGIFPHQQYLFVFLSLATIAAIACIYLRCMPRRPACRIAVGLIIGGAIGNLLDRTVMERGGCVTDWLDVYWGTCHWPAFNVADSAISVGVCIVLYLMMLKRGAENGPGEVSNR